MVRRSASSKKIVLLALASIGALSYTAISDVVETTDGKRHEGAARLANGQLVVTPAQPPVVRFRLDQVLRYTQSNTGPATGEAIEGMMGEFFSDTKLENSCAIALAPGGSYDWGHHGPNPFTPANWSARMTGYITVPQRGQYVIRSDGFSRAVVDGRELGKDKAADDRGFSWDADQRVPVLLEFRRTPGQHARANFQWSSDSMPLQPIPASAFSPADDFIKRLEEFHVRRLADSFGGLKAEYFVDPEMKKRALVRMVPQIQGAWGKSVNIDPQLKDGVAIRWTGRIKAPKTMEARFNVDNNARVWVGGKLIIDAMPGSDKEKVERSDRTGAFPVKEGEFYDLKVEARFGTGYGQLRLASNLEANWMPPLNAKFLYPPKDVPRARIVLPLENAEIGAADGAVIRVVASPGEGSSIRKVELLAEGSEEVLAEATRPPFNLVIRPEAAQDMVLRVRVTNSQGFVSASEPHRITINSAAGTVLGGEWSLGRVGDTKAPKVGEEGTRITLDARSGGFGEQSVLPLVSRVLKGDGEIVARLVELKTEQPETFALAGLTLRRGMRSDAPHVTLMASRTSGWFITKAYKNTDSGIYIEKPITLPAWIRVTRAGVNATASWSEDGKEWHVAGSMILGDDRPVIAGITAFALNADQPVTAVFDQLSVNESESVLLSSGPGIQLINGSVLQGTLTVGDYDITVRGLDGKSRAVRRGEVARVFYGPIHGSTLAELPAGWQGAILRGDKLEGPVTELSAEGATVSSLIFGPQPATRAQGLAAVQIADVVVDPKATIVRHIGGRSVGADVRIDGDHIVINGGPWSDLRLPIADVYSIRRNP